VDIECIKNTTGKDVVMKATEADTRAIKTKDTQEGASIKPGTSATGEYVYYQFFDEYGRLTVEHKIALTDEAKLLTNTTLLEGGQRSEIPYAALKPNGGVIVVKNGNDRINQIYDLY